MLLKKGSRSSANSDSVCRGDWRRRFAMMGRQTGDQSQLFAFKMVMVATGDRFHRGFR